MMNYCTRILSCALILFGAFKSPAIVVNLPVSQDTFIISTSPDNNAGGHTWFDAGRDGTGGVRRGLVRFDLSTIPPGSTITSAVVQLTVITVPGSPTNSTFDLFRLTAGWNEGTNSGSTGAPATTNDATWNNRLQFYAPWTSAGATNDIAASASASVSVDATLNATYSWSGPNVISDVQFWLGNPGLNAGWLVVSEAENAPRSVRGFAARENGANAGILQVGYTPPPAPNPATITSLSLSTRPTTPPLNATNVPPVTNGLVTLRWLGDTNGKFDLLYAETLSNAVWKFAQPNIIASVSGANVLSDPPYIAGSAFPPNTKLFYQVRSLAAAAPALAVRQQIIATNLVSPTVLVQPRDGSGRLFVADQTGQIRIVDSSGTLLATPFLDVSNRMVKLSTGYDERGLLGLVFHPGYATNGRFFIYYSAPPPSTNFDNMTVLSEFHVSATNANIADAASEQILLTVNEPEFNHEGGGLAFGPDNYLYLSLGDGGGAGDQHGTTGNAQSLTTLLGKIVRIDVNSGSPYAIPADNPFVGVPGARGEIFAYGLRNPWRFSFDRGGSHTGYIADVGQNVIEELNVMRKGANYGWRILEGNHLFDQTVAAALGVDVRGLDFPIFDYPHGPIGISIIGGFIYRGSSYPDLVGKYVFGDFSTSFGVADGQLYYLSETRPGIWELFAFQLYPGGGRFSRFVKGFGEDESGEIYVLSSKQLGPNGTTGDVRRLVRP